MNSSYQLDPYEILQVDYNASLDDIRNAFKKLVLLNHPDKGGNSQYFNIIKSAYSYIYKKKKQELLLHNKHNNNIENIVNERKSDNFTNKHKESLIINPKNFSINKFNTIYSKFRIDDPNDFGYGDEMDKSSEIRDEISNLNNNNNNNFKKQDIIIYQEPNPISSLKNNYKELGQSKINNFTNKCNNNFNFTDYKEAYSENNINSNNINVRTTNFKNVDDLLHHRSKISYKLSPEEEYKIKLKNIELKKNEEKRLWRLQQQDNTIFDKYQQLQNLIHFK